MKNTILSVVLLAVLLAGCSKAAKREPGKLLVYASFQVMADFAQKIAGDKAVVVTVVPAGAEPHGFEPTARQMAEMAGADLVVYNGAGLDDFILDMKAALPGSGAVFVEAAAVVPPLETGGQVDPHVWLDPANAVLEMSAVAEALCRADPANETFYRQNFDFWAEKCAGLDKRFEEGLSGLSNRTIVVAHEAYGYLCARYGLVQLPLEGLDAEGEPSPKRLVRVVETIRAEKIGTVFFEENASQAAVNAVREETGARLFPLSPYESLTEAQKKAGEDYFSVMEQNLENLLAALQ